MILLYDTHGILIINRLHSDGLNVLSTSEGFWFVERKTRKKIRISVATFKLRLTKLTITLQTVRSFQGGSVMIRGGISLWRKN